MTVRVPAGSKRLRPASSSLLDARPGSSLCSGSSACARTLLTQADLAVSLRQLKDWTFLFGRGLVVPFGYGLILGYLMYKSGSSLGAWPGSE